MEEQKMLVLAEMKAQCTTTEIVRELTKDDPHIREIEIRVISDVLKRLNQEKYSVKQAEYVAEVVLDLIPKITVFDG